MLELLRDHRPCGSHSHSSGQSVSGERRDFESLLFLFRCASVHWAARAGGSCPASQLLRPEVLVLATAATLATIWCQRAFELSSLLFRACDVKRLSSLSNDRLRGCRSGRIFCCRRCPRFAWIAQGLLSVLFFGRVVPPIALPARTPERILWSLRVFSFIGVTFGARLLFARVQFGTSGID